MTRLETFLKGHRILPAPFARDAGISRRYLWRLRRGESEPTRRVIRLLVRAAQRWLGRKVSASEMFDLGDESR